jgi:cytochrome c oxidase cbb3-type subunit I/II
METAIMAKSRMTSRMKMVGIALALLVGCCASGFAQEQEQEKTNQGSKETRVGNLTGHVGSGKALYRRYCISCHGAHGDGAGESAPQLDPKPRDFTKATFKCRSTPSGTLPTDTDLYDTISRGIFNSNMPPWRPLTREQRVDLIAFVKTFSSRFQEEKPGVPLSIPPEPPSSAASVQRGAQLFQDMNCWSCHGKEGRGNGPSAVTLTDNKGNPIHPFDFTTGTRMKCGEGGPTIFRDLMTGLDGTPMPSFADALNPDQAWDLVHFIESLSAANNRGFFARLAAKNE